MGSDVDGRRGSYDSELPRHINKALQSFMAILRGDGAPADQVCRSKAAISRISRAASGRTKKFLTMAAHTAFTAMTALAHVLDDSRGRADVKGSIRD
jgi:hypothetical protein